MKVLGKELTIATQFIKQLGIKTHQMKVAVDVAKWENKQVKV